MCFKTQFILNLLFLETLYNQRGHDSQVIALKLVAKLKKLSQALEMLKYSYYEIADPEDNLSSGSKKFRLPPWLSSGRLERIQMDKMDKIAEERFVTKVTKTSM